MNDERCQRYLENPEANAAHLQECPECRAVSEALDTPVAADPIAVPNLPLAPWEGAGYRSWPLVVGGALTVLVIAIVLFSIGGISPLRGFTQSVAAQIPPLDVVMTLLGQVGNGVQHAPTPWQVGIAISFVVVNTILVLLLRRSPRGIDV